MPRRPARALSRSAVLVGALSATLLLSSCVEAGRTRHPDSDVAVSCPVEVDPSITTSVRIAYQQIPNGDLVVRDLGWLEACMPNATISWNQFNSGGDVIQAFGSNSVDLGLVGSSPATKAVSAPLNIEMQVIWVHDVIGRAESLIVRDPAIKDIDGLKGKKIGVPFASTAHYSLLSALDDSAIGMDGAQLINMSPDSMLAAWQRGEIDAAWVWDPTLSQLLKDGHIVLSSEDTAKLGKPTFDLAAARTDFVKANPEFMLMWTRLQDKAVGVIKDDPTTAAESIAIQLGSTPDAVKTQLKGYTYLSAKEQAGPDYFGGKLGQDLLATAKFLHDQREIDAVSPDDAYTGAIYTTAVEEVGK